MRPETIFIWSQYLKENRFELGFGKTRLTENTLDSHDEE